jgi:hypothetical protein
MAKRWRAFVRHLMDKAVVHVERDSEYAGVTIHWPGGFTSRHEVVRPVRSYEPIRDLDKRMDRVAAQRSDTWNKPARDCDFFDFVSEFLRRPALGGCTIRVHERRVRPRIAWSMLI